MARLLLLRHGQSTWNAESRWQGWADPPLAPRGEVQAEAAAALLGDVEVDAVASSDLRRARQTADIIARGIGLDPDTVIVESGLRERDVGDWTGLTVSEIETRWPGMLDQWRRGMLPAPPGGENHASLEARVVATVHALAARSEEVILAVTHGGVIHTLDRYLGAELNRIGNLCGRWVESGPLAGEAFVLPDLDEAPTTAL